MNAAITNNLEQVIEQARHRLHNQVDGCRSRIKIISDGTLIGTYAMVDGVILDGVTPIDINADARGTNSVFLTITIQDPLLDFDGVVLTKDLCLECER